MSVMITSKAFAFNAFMQLVWKGGDLYDCWGNAEYTAQMLFNAKLIVEDKGNVATFDDGSSVIIQDNGACIIQA